MTTVKNQYNPLSIEQQVKNRLEKRSSGVSPPDIVPSRTHTAGVNKPLPHQKLEDTNSDLPTEFMNLLFSSEQNDLPALTEKNNLPVSGEHSKNAGTNPVFFPLNKQEESVCKSDKEKEPFSLTIESADLGPLKLNGKWNGDKLQVHLHLPNKMDIQQQRILTAILERKLSHELGVKTEIVID